MKLTEALQTLREGESSRGTAFPVLLACGFTPLHLETFFGAHLQKSLPGRQVRVASGLYGDLAGTLEREPSEGTQGVAVALEWPDLEARLGYRSLGGWGPAREAEIAHQVQAALGRLCLAIERLSLSIPVVVSLTSLPLPPSFVTPGWEAGKVEVDRTDSGFHAGVLGPDDVMEGQQVRLDPPAAQRDNYYVFKKNQRHRNLRSGPGIHSL